MQITAIFENIEEMKEFSSLFNAQFMGEYGTPIDEKKFTEDVKATMEETMKAAKDFNNNKSKKADKKETPKVEAEIVEVDNSTQDEPKDAEVVNEDKPSDNGPVVTKEMIRTNFSKLVKAGKTKEAKDLLTKYKANKISEVAEEHYAKLFEEVKELIS